MKQLPFVLTLAALLLAGCHRDKKEFSTVTIEGKQCYQITYPEELGPWGTTVGLKKSFSVAWPAAGVLTSAAERELMMLCFGDSSAAHIDAAARAWLAKPYLYEEDGENENTPVDTLDESREFSYVNIESTTEHDSMLATFIVRMECYGLGAAHGIYSVDYLTVDLESGNAIHLTDLVTDTNLLCEAVAHAIQDLEVNRDVRECLFDEFCDVERMPLPRNFTIDSARNSITVTYSLYDIQPYACGIPSIVLPIYWLSKHVELTPYAKRLFGSGSYIKE